jgi:hypothetical protein
MTTFIILIYFLDVLKWLSVKNVILNLINMEFLILCKTFHV